MRKIYFTMLLLLVAFSTSLIAQTAIPLPNHSSTYSGNVRGYWFQAPSCFTITGAEIPTSAGTGAQNIAILRFQAQPPSYSATTNAFTTLLLVQNGPTAGVIPANIQVETGDWIGVLGQRATANSYATGAYVSNVNGVAMTLERLGMQYQLGTTAPQDCWTELGGSISRTILYYDSTITYNLTATNTSGTTYDFDNGADSSFVSSWDFGDGNTANTATATHTYAMDGIYNVCSIVTNACGTDTLCTTLTVCGNIPTAAFTPSTTGLTVNFSDSSTNASTYAWDFGDGNTDTTASPSHTYATVGWYNVCLTTTSSCGLMDTICDSILVCSPPVAAMTAMNTAPGAFTFMDGSSFGTNYFWDFGDGNTDTTQNPMHTYSADGTYIVCLTVDNLCGTDTICDSVNVCLTAPTASFTSVDNAFSVDFTSTIAGASGQMWDFGDGNSSTAANPTNVYAANGTYNVCLSAWNICGDTTVSCDTVVIFVIGVDNALPGFDISISPNPMNDQAVLMVQNAGEQGEYVVELYNVLGSKVQSAECDFNNALVVERNGLATGMYVFKIRQGDLVLGTGRIILE